VTTRRRKLWVLNSLRRGFHSMAARFLVLGMLRFDVGHLATFTLSPRCVLAANFPQVQILTVALVVTLRLVFAFTPFVQAGPRTWATPSGLGTSFPFTLAGAHGRFNLPKKSSGRMCPHPPRALSKHG
jgi:hypothetical protein